MERLTNYQADVLADVLQSLHLQGSLYCHAQMGAPWGLGVPRRDVATFHIVTGGQCWLRVEGLAGPAEPTPLSDGDMVILPGGHAHGLTDPAGAAVTMLEELVREQPAHANGTFQSGGSSPLTTLICGHFQIADRRTNPLVSALPPLVHIRNAQGKALPWLRTLVNLIKTEASLNRPGTEIVVTRLSEILFVQAVRAFINSSQDQESGWLGALKDPRIGLALKLIHHNPEQAWTVDSLAGCVGMSRTGFSMRFSRLLGEPPLHYVTRCRLNRAAVYLRTSTKKLAEIADLVGYASEASFSKAFKRNLGVTPDRYRRSTNAPQAPIALNDNL